VSGTVFHPQPDLEAGGNVVSAFSGPVPVSLTGGNSSATLSGTFPVTAPNGVAAFNDLSADLTGSYTLTASTFGVGSAGPSYDLLLSATGASSQGGTGFWRHRATGYESLDDQQHQHMRALIEQDIAVNGPVPQAYVNAENRLYELTANFEARFNRVLAVRSRVLHSGMILSTTRLDPNPCVGRLT
jgi:hypothetical protein